MIEVTKPFLPPIGEYENLVKGVWESGWLTNNGTLVKQLEKGVASFVGMEESIYVSNGTIALQLAIAALGLEGDIITTPFSYVATTNSILWQKCNPVFADIDEDSLNIDSKQIRNSITKKTSAILATHVFGNPCNIEELEKIGNEFKIPIIYDGAHALGTLYKGKSLLDYGTISITSFHATKLFHTVEGGGVFSKDKLLLNKVRSLMNFGHSGTNTFEMAGINGKNSELHAAMGMTNLKYLDEIIAKRKSDYNYYQSILIEKKGLKFQKISDNTDYNGSYFPVIFETVRDLQLNQ